MTNIGFASWSPPRAALTLSPVRVGSRDVPPEPEANTEPGNALVNSNVPLFENSVLPHVQAILRPMKRGQDFSRQAFILSTAHAWLGNSASPQTGSLLPQSVAARTVPTFMKLFCNFGFALGGKRQIPSGSQRE